MRRASLPYYSNQEEYVAAGTHTIPSYLLSFQLPWHQMRLVKIVFGEHCLLPVPYFAATCQAPSEHVADHLTSMRLSFVALAAAFVLFGTSSAVSTIGAAADTKVLPDTPSNWSRNLRVEESSVKRAGVDTVEEDEERGLKPSASADAWLVKLFYKIFPHVQKPKPEGKHVPFKGLRLKSIGNGKMDVVPRSYRG
ncbi:uncharacterized protein KRP23_5205 [Phytophthora ramorum]|uniref:uncharacterized protein n=1 Tax=Phytophthora ramorum TaxID=164328 RepID=UPI0030A51B7B|nr:hypothetical protein KRP23_5205 [Phytophthora ramorum]